MKTLTTTFIILVFSLQSLCLLSQETDFEVDIADDSLNIIVTNFLNDYNNGFVGLVKKAPLYADIKYYTSYLYRVNQYGDTTSVSFPKEDTICDYYDFIPVNLGEPGYLLAGLIQPLEGSDIYNIFTRLDTNLNILWEKTFNFDFYYSGWEMRTMQLKDSSFLYCCSPGGVNVFLFNLSYAGDSLMYRAYDGDSAGEVQSLTYNFDSTKYLLHNKWGHNLPGPVSSSCIEIDAKLNQTNVWYYEEHYINPFTTKLFYDRSLISVGRYFETPPPDFDEVSYIGVYKYDSTFNLLYYKMLTNPDTNSRAGEKLSIDYYYPEYFYVAGSHNAQDITGTTPSWFYIAKMNDTLGIDYEKYIGGDDYYMLFSVLATKDKGVLLAGTRAKVNAPIFHRDGYIIKLDSTGCIPNLDENSGVQIKEALVYPNPGKEKLMVRTALKNCTLVLYTANGTKVLSQYLESHITQISTGRLKTGTYVYVIEQNNKVVESGKWIKQ